MWLYSVISPINLLTMFIVFLSIDIKFFPFNAGIYWWIRLFTKSATQQIFKTAAILKLIAGSLRSGKAELKLCVPWGCHCENGFANDFWGTDRMYNSKIYYISFKQLGKCFRLTLICRYVRRLLNGAFWKLFWQMILPPAIGQRWKLCHF